MKLSRINKEPHIFALINSDQKSVNAQSSFLNMRLQQRHETQFIFFTPAGITEIPFIWRSLYEDLTELSKYYNYVELTVLPADRKLVYEPFYSLVYESGNNVSTLKHTITSTFI